ncbi:MAG: hypothetical protein R3C56_39540 [Pirellulaceae bacterium]
MRTQLAKQWHRHAPQQHAPQGDERADGSTCAAGRVSAAPVRKSLDGVT